MHIKITVRHYITLVRIVIKKSNKFCLGFREKGALIHFLGIYINTELMENAMEIPQ